MSCGLLGWQAVKTNQAEHLLTQSILNVASRTRLHHRSTSPRGKPRRGIRLVSGGELTMSITLGIYLRANETKLRISQTLSLSGIAAAIP